MNRLLAALSIWLCGGATVAGTQKPMTADTYCPFVVEAAAHALWQFEKDECGFAFDEARKGSALSARDHASSTFATRAATGGKPSS